MQPKHYTATQSHDGKWFFTFPGGQSSGWHHQGQCQRVADSHRPKPKTRKLGLRITR